MSDPAAQPRAAGSRLPLVLTGVLLVVAVGLAVVLFTVVRPGPDETPSGVAGDFVGRLQHGRYDSARDLLCDNGKAQLSTGDALRHALRFDPTAITGHRVGDVSKVGGATTVTVDIDGVPGHRTLTLDVVKQHGRQTVCGIGG